MSKTNSAHCPASFLVKGASARTNSANRRGAELAKRDAAGEALSAEEKAMLRRYQARKVASDAAYEAWKVEEAARGAATQAKAAEMRAVQQASQDAARKTRQEAVIAQYLADPSSVPPFRAAWCKAELERRARGA